MFAEIMALALALFGTAYVFLVGSRIVWTALRTGKLLARGTVYDRQEKPKRFCLGIAFWIVLAVLFLSASVGLLQRVAQNIY